MRDLFLLRTATAGSIYLVIMAAAIMKAKKAMKTSRDDPEKAWAGPAPLVSGDLRNRMECLRARSIL